MQPSRWDSWVPSCPYRGLYPPQGISQILQQHPSSRLGTAGVTSPLRALSPFTKPQAPNTQTPLVSPGASSLLEEAAWALLPRPRAAAKQKHLTLPCQQRGEVSGRGQERPLLARGTCTPYCHEGHGGWTFLPQASYSLGYRRRALWRLSAHLDKATADLIQYYPPFSSEWEAEGSFKNILQFHDHFHGRDTSSLC